MVTLPIFKRGDTWSLTSTLTHNGTGVDISNIDIRSQIRKSDKTLIAELVATRADQKVTPGAFILTPLNTDTTSWPLGSLLCDIIFTHGDKIITTETFTLVITEEVTQ